uniref:J domain-containing protein n=1 Tax=Ananas comosus var. bracteatus TaxID=296719 RepID=A0A6V7NYF8_ANACO|nr:unnamed protein product [Ananas comosus var. bracteatus]
MSLELEYRRGQALSAISAAEERFRARDFPAAWMLALQARSFFPSLLGLHSAITAYDVLRRSAAAPKLPPGKSGDWRDVLDAVGGSPDHDAVEARYRNLCTLLTDPARTEFAAAAADEALKIVEQAWREFKAGQSRKVIQGRAEPVELVRRLFGYASRQFYAEISDAGEDEEKQDAETTVNRIIFEGTDDENSCGRHWQEISLFRQAVEADHVGVMPALR